MIWDKVIGGYLCFMLCFNGLTQLDSKVTRRYAAVAPKPYTEMPSTRHLTGRTGISDFPGQKDVCQAALSLLTQGSSASALDHATLSAKTQILAKLGFCGCRGKKQVSTVCILISESLRYHNSKFSSSFKILSVIHNWLFLCTRMSAVETVSNYTFA